MRTLRRASTSRRAVALVALSALLAGVVIVSAGCAEERPIVTQADMTSDMTMTEQRLWVADRLDAAVSASAADGWFDLHWNDVFWPEDRDALISGLFPDTCGGAGGQIVVTLLNVTAEDARGTTTRVRDYWKSQGATVRDLYDSGDRTDPYFIVDFEDGGSFSMEADDRGMSMTVQTSCSLHRSSANWLADLDDGGNPFEEELVQREEAAVDAEADAESAAEAAESGRP